MGLPLQTWERLHTKYAEVYADLERLMDPSRNMNRYRNLLIECDIVVDCHDSSLSGHLRSRLWCPSFPSS